MFAEKVFKGKLILSEFTQKKWLCVKGPENLPASEKGIFNQKKWFYHISDVYHIFNLVSEKELLPTSNVISKVFLGTCKTPVSDSSPETHTQGLAVNMEPPSFLLETTTTW